MNRRQHTESRSKACPHKCHTDNRYQPLWGYSSCRQSAACGKSPCFSYTPLLVEADGGLGYLAALLEGLADHPVHIPSLHTQKSLLHDDSPRLPYDLLHRIGVVEPGAEDLGSKPRAEAFGELQVLDGCCVGDGPNCLRNNCGNQLNH